MFKCINYFLVFFSLILVISACKEEEIEDELPVTDEIRINIEPLYNGEHIDFEKIFETQEGYRIRYTKINIITTELRNSSNELLAPSAVYKMEDHPTLLFQGEGDYTLFDDLGGYVGVPEDQNHLDPSARPLSDPLNIMNTGDMHWGWDPGYIFLMIEGRADTTATGAGNLDRVFLYHVGMNELLRSFFLDNLNWVKVNNHLHETTIQIDMEKVFNHIHQVNIKLEPTSHTDPGQEPLSTKIIENFVAAIRAK